MKTTDNEVAVKGNIAIRKGKSKDAQDFSRLILLSAPTLFPVLFGSNAAEVLKRLFQQPRNLFSFEHSYFAEVNGKTAGMVLAYNSEHKRREDLRTGLLLVKYLKWSFLARIPYLLKAESMVGRVAQNEYYVSNIAVYPKFRGLGLGTNLLLQIEQEARKTGNNKVALDVETSNHRAIKLYQRLGYITEKVVLDVETGNRRAFKLCQRLGCGTEKETLEFFRMSKPLEL